MTSVQINHPTLEGEPIIFLKTFDQSFTLEIEDESLVTITCEDVSGWNELFDTNYSEEKSNKMVRALEILLEREGKQLEAIYKELENEVK